MASKRRVAGSSDEEEEFHDATPPPKRTRTVEFSENSIVYEFSPPPKRDKRQKVDKGKGKAVDLVLPIGACHI